MLFICIIIYYPTVFVGFKPIFNYFNCFVQGFFSKVCFPFANKKMIVSLASKHFNFNKIYFVSIFLTWQNSMFRSTRNIDKPNTSLKPLSVENPFIQRVSFRERFLSIQRWLFYGLFKFSFSYPSMEWIQRVSSNE